MRLDLGRSAVLEPAHRAALDALALEARHPFNDLIRRLSTRHGDNIDWWVTPVASRNVFSCELFARCCQLLLAVRAAESKAIREIVVESPSLAAVLRKSLAGRQPKVSVRTRSSTLRWRAALFAGMCYRLAAAGYHAIGQLVCSRLFRSRSRPAAGEPIVLVDTFVYRDSFTHGYRDRHYPGLLDHLDAVQRRRVYFLPTYFKIKNYAWLFRTLRGSAANFLLKEDWLGTGDYLFALGHPFRLLAFTVDRCDFEGMDVAPMVNEALFESFAASGSIEGLLRYRLAARLRDARVAVSLLLDWFENQEIDHGSNAGFRRFLPETRIVGYQGFVVSRHYLCMFPTHEEMRLELLPHRVAVTGRALVSGAREFCPELEVGEAPAFRFSGLWRERKPRAGSRPFTILVALPLMREESAQILETVAASAAAFPCPADGVPWRVIVKSHPAADIEPLRGARVPAAARFEAAEGSFDDVLGDCDILVSSASSVCVQALASGVPVIVLGNSRGITFNPIPDDIDREVWALCYTPDELTAALCAYQHRDAATVERHRRLGAAIRERFFAPVTSDSVAALLAPPVPPAAAARGEAAC